MATCNVEMLRRKIIRLEESRRGGHEKAVSTRCGPLDELLPEGGVRRGALAEWLAAGEGSGSGTLALLCAREACRDGGTLVVLDDRREFYPPAAVRLGIALEQLVVVRANNPADNLWALDQALRCPAVAAVLAWPEKLDGRVFRRLQLAAEEGGGLGLLVRPEAARCDPSWADLRMFVEPLPSTDFCGAGVSPRRTVAGETPAPQRGGCGSICCVAAVEPRDAAWTWKSMMKRMLCIWLPHWPRQREALARSSRDSMPPLDARPAVEGNRGRHCFGEAVAHDANQSLARLADREALAALAAYCHRFSPAVGVEVSADAGESVVGHYRPGPSFWRRSGVGPADRPRLCPTRARHSRGDCRHHRRGVGRRTCLWCRRLACPEQLQARRLHHKRYLWRAASP